MGTTSTSKAAPTPAERARARRRLRIRVLVAVIVFGLLSPLIVYVWMAASTKALIYERLEDAPKVRTGLLLGTAKQLPSGMPNPFFTHRIKAAVLLYQSGKIERILVSGDHYGGYNEPVFMRDALRRDGIPDSVIVLDHAGYRTLDSVVRAYDQYGSDTCIVISQRFHIERALFIAQQRGIPAYGYVAADPSSFGSRVRLTLRELAARMGTVLDVFVLNTQPGPRT